jgi:hypothetical protein
MFPNGRAADGWCRLSAGGCDVAEDPSLDGRVAQPLWLTPSAGLLHVRAVHPLAATTQRFDLWRIAGRKRLVLEGADLTLTADQYSERVRLTLSGTVAHGDAYESVVPLTPRLRGQIERFGAVAEMLEGQLPRIARLQAASRAALLHLRALQVLDASQAGASHRAIAEAVFGSDAVVLRWSEDGELRAQVRFLVRRAQGLMNGGYLALAGVLRHPARAPGDEPIR